MNKEHNKSVCDYAHNWQDFRRKPNLFNYSNEMCEKWQATTFITNYDEGCPDMASCTKSHGWKEQAYHPKTYKIDPCKQANCRNRFECIGYHNEQDRRYLTQPMQSPRERNFPEITIYNCVVSNVNHLREIIISLCGEKQLSLQEYEKLFAENNYPQPVLTYMKKLGMVKHDPSAPIVQNINPQVEDERKNSSKDLVVEI